MCILISDERAQHVAGIVKLVIKDLGIDGKSDLGI
jgi:hypothetical protein